MTYTFWMNIENFAKAINFLSLLWCVLPGFSTMKKDTIHNKRLYVNLFHVIDPNGVAFLYQHLIYNSSSFLGAFRHISRWRENVYGDDIILIMFSFFFSISRLRSSSSRIIKGFILVLRITFLLGLSVQTGCWIVNRSILKLWKWMMDGWTMQFSVFTFFVIT